MSVVGFCVIVFGSERGRRGSLPQLEDLNFIGSNSGRATSEGTSGPLQVFVWGSCPSATSATEGCPTAWLCARAVETEKALGDNRIDISGTFNMGIAEGVPGHSRQVF